MSAEREIAMDDDEDAAIGATIGDHYVIDARVAEGGMGRVYRAHHLHLERRTFAVKLLRGDLASTADMRRRFLHEASVLSLLEHPNIVSVVDLGRTPCGVLYMVMDFVPGISLAELISRGPLPPARAVAIARQLVLGLEHIHDHGVIHRDFKPDNVVVSDTDDGDVARIVDFGLALTDDPRAARVTREGIAVGTPSYIAPEQARGLALDGRADLFALGVSLYEMLAGVPPFEGPPLEVVRLNATEDPPSIAERSGEVVPAALERIVRRLIERSPDARFASAREVIDALDALDAGELDAVGVPGAPDVPVAPDVPMPVPDPVPAPVPVPEPMPVPVPTEPVVVAVPEQTERISLLPLRPVGFVPVRARRRGPTLVLGTLVLAAAAVVGVTIAGHSLGGDRAAASTEASVRPPPPAASLPTTPALPLSSPPPAITTPTNTTPTNTTPTPPSPVARPVAPRARARARAVHAAPAAPAVVAIGGPVVAAGGPVDPPEPQVVDPFTTATSP